MPINAIVQVADKTAPVIDVLLRLDHTKQYIFLDQMYLRCFEPMSHLVLDLQWWWLWKMQTSLCEGLTKSVEYFWNIVIIFLALKILSCCTIPSWIVKAMGLREKSGWLFPAGISSTNCVIITPGTLDRFLMATKESKVSKKLKAVIPHTLNQWIWKKFSVNLKKNWK